jgi:ClpP class serine protease
MSKEERLKIIEEIEKKRESKLVCYATSDRPNFQFPISMDATRLFNDHLRLISQDKKCDKIDLFLYSRGGDTRVPWIVVRTFREYCNEFDVLIPFRAHSAATMIALGADNIVMGKEGELSPIDPTIGNPLCPRDPADKTRIIGVNVADLTGYIELVKEKVGITNQQELAITFSALAKEVHPLALGGINRHLSFIRLVAKRLLSSHNKKIEEAKVNKIIDDLVEKTFSTNIQ